jgi:UrcA family protein
MNTSTFISKHRLCTFLAIAALGAASAGGARADDSDDIRVRFNDLNPGTSIGAAALYERIDKAAKRACGFRGSDVVEAGYWKSCVRLTVDAAVKKANRPQLTALHAGRGNKAATTAMLNK